MDCESKSTAEYQRELYAMRKRCHLCTKCGKQDAYTMNGRSRCFGCQDKRRKHPVDYVPEKKQRKSHPRQLGVYCWLCNKEKPMSGKNLCPACYEKACKSIAYGREVAKKQGYKWHYLRFGKEALC